MKHMKNSTTKRMVTVTAYILVLIMMLQAFPQMAFANNDTFDYVLAEDAIFDETHTWVDAGFVETLGDMAALPFDYHHTSPICVTFEPDPLLEAMMYEPPVYVVMEDWTQLGRASFDYVPTAEAMDLMDFPELSSLTLTETWEASLMPTPSPPVPPEYMRPPDMDVFQEQVMVEGIDRANANTSYVNIRYVSSTQTSITLDLHFHYFSPNNSISHFNYRNNHWTHVYGAFRFGLPSIGTRRLTLNNLMPGTTYLFRAYAWSWTRMSWVIYDLRVTTVYAIPTSLSVVSRTQTSFTLHVNFPISGDSGNILEFHDGTRWRPVTNQGSNVRNGLHTVTGLRPGGTYHIRLTYFDRQLNRWGPDIRHNLALQPVRAPLFTATEVTATSFILHVIFPVDHMFNAIYMFTGWGFPNNDALVRGAFNGFITLANLESGWTYRFYIYYFDQNGAYHRYDIQVRTTETHARFPTRDLVFYLNPRDITPDRISANSLYVWTNRMQIFHDDMHSLTGRRPWRGTPMVIRSTRYVATLAHAGNPIRVHYTHIPWEMTQVARGCWSFLMMHELSHNFDDHTSDAGRIRYGASWNFNGEFFANFKIGYVMDRRNAFFYHWGVYRVSGIAGYMAYFRSFHVTQTNSGRFSHNAMTYSFFRIQRTIGWEPFRRTFRHFNSLPHDYYTQTYIQRFELFINRLSHYSGRNVTNLFTPQERDIYWRAMRNPQRYF